MDNTGVILEVILNSELVHAAIIEALHRHYYDKVMPIYNNKVRDKEVIANHKIIGDFLSIAWHTKPDWREIIHEKHLQYKDSFDELRIFGRIDAMPIILSPNITHVKKRFSNYSGVELSHNGNLRTDSFHEE